MLLRYTRAQSTLEYALIIAAVVAGLIMMQIYMKRGVGGRMKQSVDQIGSQFDPVAYSGNITTNYTRISNEMTQNRVTTSSITNEQTRRTGSTTLNAWSNAENLYRGY